MSLICLFVLTRHGIRGSSLSHHDIALIVHSPQTPPCHVMSYPVLSCPVWPRWTLWSILKTWSHFMILPHWPGPLWIPWRARDISSTRISAALLCDPSDPLLDAPSPARFPLDPLVSPMVSVQPDTCGPPTWPIRPHQWLPLPTCPVPLPGTSDELAISYTLDDERLSQIIRPYFYADSPSTREKDTAWGWSST